jgi:acetyl esterase/lipase
MTLDPELAAVGPDLPPTDLTDVVAARDTNVRRRPVAGYHRAPEARSTDTTVPGPGGPLAVRVYRPVVAPQSPAPTVLWIHGGAFSMGTLESSDAVCQQLAVEGGAAVVNLDYRLAPEHPYPAALDDCWAALEWVAEHLDELGGAGSALVVAGSSAGGALAAAVALRARDTGRPRLAAQVLVQPVLDHRRATHSARTVTQSPVFTATSNTVMWQNYLGGATPDAYASPALADDLAGLPTAYVTAAAHDPLRDEAVDYASRLLQAGVDVELHVYPGAFHGFDTLVPTAAVSRRAMADLVAAVVRLGALTTAEARA